MKTICAAGQRPFDKCNRAHFLAVAPPAHAPSSSGSRRTHGAAKAGADQRARVESRNRCPPGYFSVRHGTGRFRRLPLTGLLQFEPSKAGGLEMRFLAASPTEEIAARVLGSFPHQIIKREWSIAKAWINRALKKGGWKIRGWV